MWFNVHAGPSLFYFCLSVRAWLMTATVKVKDDDKMFSGVRAKVPWACYLSSVCQYQPQATLPKLHSGLWSGRSRWMPSPSSCWCWLCGWMSVSCKPLTQRSELLQIRLHLNRSSLMALKTLRVNSPLFLLFLFH